MQWRPRLRAGWLALIVVVAACDAAPQQPEPGPVVPAVSRSRSTLLLDRTSAPADGVTQVIAVVTVRDDAGGPLPGRLVRLAYSGAVTPAPPTQATDASGEAVFQLLSSEPTAGALTATVDPGPGEVVLGPAPSLTFLLVTHAVGGAVSGVLGEGLRLASLTGTEVAVPAGAAVYELGRFPRGATYAVVVARQPTHPWQTCTVSNASGTIGEADVTDADVACTTDTFALGGRVSGLGASGLVLSTPGQPVLVVDAAMTDFRFEGVPSGGAYAVSVAQQPTGWTCTVSGGTGVIAGADVATVEVSCAANVYRLGGSVEGLTGTGLRLITPGQASLPVRPGAGTFAFPIPLTFGAPYAVTVAYQPTHPWQTCVVSAGEGTVEADDVTDVRVACATDTHALGGTVSGLTEAGLVLSSPGLPDVDVAPGSTSFTFAAPLASGSTYAISVARQPTGTTCSVSWGAGTVAGVDVSGVAVACTPDRYAIGGTVTGLAGSGLVLRTAGEPDLTLAPGATTFRFASTLPHGAAYAISVAAQPTGPWQACTISGGSGTIVAADVTDIQIACITRAFALRGSVAGLGEAGLVLGTTGQPDLTVEPGAVEFEFPARVESGAAYEVRVVAQPSGLRCSVSSAIGVVEASDPAGVAVYCADPHLAWTQVACGEDFTVGLKDDGSLWTWGASKHGSLGDGGVADRPLSQQIGVGFRRIAAGSNHGLGIRQDGTLWAWGRNDAGQVGDGTTASRGVPVQVGDANDWADVSGGVDHTMALRADGTLWAWGSSYTGQLGDGSHGTFRAEPVQVQVGAAHWGAIAAGWVHTLALGSDGTLWAWGSNNSSQLGDGSWFVGRDVPAPVGSDADWVAVAAHNGQSLAIKRDGSLWAWGGSSAGELGLGPGTSSATPARVGTDVGWTLVAAGALSSLGLRSDGSLWAWGTNSDGQVGDGSGLTRWSPVRIGLSTTWTAASKGWRHAVALDADGELWAWGDNSRGELGDGTTLDRALPVHVATP